jgi:HTH-type transcriptional regulator/antitoxin HigA
LEELGINQTALSNRIGLSRKVINEIITGKAPITATTAIFLERVLNVPAHFWNNLQKNYDLNLAVLQQQEGIQQDIKALKRFPVKQMIDYGWIPEAKTKEEKVYHLYKFFSIARLNNFENALAIRFRRSIKKNVSKESIFAWLRKGELEVQRIETNEFDKKRLLDSLPYFRTLSKSTPEVFQSEIKKKCADAGVAVAFIPDLPKTYINGATFWLTNSRAALLLSLRFKTNDHLWFSFFHEIAHLLIHKNTGTFIDLDENSLEPEEQKREKEADEFAANILIPSKEWEKFKVGKHFSKARVLQFSHEIGLAPGIVVGRLQNEGLILYSHLNGLKERYDWVVKR